jgi:DNA-binding beta-propeller fold protein YncE
MSFARIARSGIAFAAMVLALGAAAAGAAPSSGNRDLLFVGDGVAFSVLPKDNRVEVFDAITGTWRRSLTPSGLLGPRGIVTRAGNLFLVNQNVFTDFTGEVLRFNAATGSPVKRLVPADTRHAPFAPRGMILWNDHLFVANVCDPCEPPKKQGGGGVLKYTAAGKFVGRLHPPAGAQFHPFGVVIGPDGLLYVSSRPTLFSTGLGGQVLQFNPTTGDFIKVFITDAGGPGHLNGPEGLAFGPDGRLYITSLRADENDTDKILIFEGPGGAHPGAYAGKFDLDKVGKLRSVAAALLFGPGGDLFVPITNAFLLDSPDGIGKDRGAIRRYRPGCKQTATRQCFSYFVHRGGQLGAGWYLTFGKTQPGTLAYGG